MSLNIPDNLPILSGGKQQPGSGKVCFEQAINWLVSDRLDLGDETDHPECVQPVLNALAIYVNDKISNKNRHKMWPFALRQIGTSKPEMEPQLSVDLAKFATKYAAKYAIESAAKYAAKYAKYAKYAIEYAEYAAKYTEYAAKFAAESAAKFAAESTAEYAAKYAAESTAEYAAKYAIESAIESAKYAAYVIKSANRLGLLDQDSLDDALLEILGAFHDEYERLTGHVPQSCDISRIARLGELVGFVQ